MSELILGPSVTILIGLTGTGKTTLAGSLVQTIPSLILNKDEIKLMLAKDYSYNIDLDLIVDKVHQDAFEIILSEIILGSSYNSVIIDNTNLLKVERVALMNTIKKIEKDYNKENFFSIQYIYLIEGDDKTDDCLSRRISSDLRGMEEEWWFSVLEHQRRLIQIPDSKEIEDYKISMTMMNTFGI